jgi:hypothetical protein
MASLASTAQQRRSPQPRKRLQAVERPGLIPRCRKLPRWRNAGPGRPAAGAGWNGARTTGIFAVGQPAPADVRNDGCAYRAREGDCTWCQISCRFSRYFRPRETTQATPWRSSWPLAASADHLDYLSPLSCAALAYTGHFRLAVALLRGVELGVEFARQSPAWWGFKHGGSRYLSL